MIITLLSTILVGERRGGLKIEGKYLKNKFADSVGQSAVSLMR